MKNLLIPLCFIVFSTTGMVNKSHAMTSTITRPANSPVSAYCDVDRFEDYIELAASMRDYVTPSEYAKLYIPLKVKASKAKITIKNYGALSSRTHAAILDIVKFVSTHENEFDALWEVESFFDVAQDLMDMTQTLARDLE